MAEEWVNVSQAAKRIGRNRKTVFNWVRLDPSGVKKRREGNHWMVEMGSVIAKDKASQSKTIQYTRLNSIDELEETACPHCHSPRYDRKGWGTLGSGEISIGLKCINPDCNQMFRVRLPAGTKMRKNKKKYIPALTIVRGQPTDDPADTWDKVLADRQRFVTDFVKDGLPLRKILAVFSPNMKQEITDYYIKAYHQLHNAGSGDGHQPQDSQNFRLNGSIPSPAIPKT